MKKRLTPDDFRSNFRLVCVLAMHLGSPEDLRQEMREAGMGVNEINAALADARALREAILLLRQL